MTDTPWLNQKEAAEYACQSADAIRAAVRSGDLKAYAIGKSGREFRLHREDIDEWMKDRPWEPKTDDRIARAVEQDVPPR